MKDANMKLCMFYIQRKKKVADKYDPDTFRVISDDAVSAHPKYLPQLYRSSFEPRTPTPNVMPKKNNVDDGESKRSFALEPSLKSTRVLPQLLPDFRAHKPQPTACGFLDKNVRFLNEPVCTVFTRNVQHEEKYWWPERVNPGHLQIPPFTEDTQYRRSYNYRHGERPMGAGRHTANKNKEPALGAIPVNCLRERDGSQRLYQEGLSYEHMYDSRSESNYPIRGKRHGSFIWSRMDPLSQQKFIEYYQRLQEEEEKAVEAGVEGPITANLRGNTPVIRSPNHRVSSRQNSSLSSSSSIRRKSEANDGLKLNTTSATPSVLEPNPPPSLPAIAAANEVIPTAAEKKLP